MRSSLKILFTAAVLAPGVPSYSQPAASAPAATEPAPVFEPVPTLNAAEILQPAYFQGPNFSVRVPVPTFAGSNQYTIDTPFGIFQADGNAMLIRRIAEINGIAALQEVSKSKEFGEAAAQAATVPINVARDLVTQPVETISSVPRGLWNLVNNAGTAIKQAATSGTASPDAVSNAVSSMTGFSKTKRDIALRLGVDPYTDNQVFQTELSKVAWPVFLGKFTVGLGFSAISGGVGTALSAANVTNSLVESVREKSPADLRKMNLALLTNTMGVPAADASAFLDNPAISPTTQTILVATLGQLGNIPGQTAFIRQAATSQSEHDALAYQQSVQIMAKLNTSSPITRITHVSGLPVCQTKDGTVVVPIQWDYVAWTPAAAAFIAALKAQSFTPPPAAYTVMITGTMSPLTLQNLAALNVNAVQLALPGPLR
jgi:hypothetical protein